jgi:hypothetical protein
MENIKDNIESLDVIHDDAADKYMRRFETVESHNNTLKSILKEMDFHPDDQQRLYGVISYIHELQKQNNEMLDLMVEMNNFFCK